MILDTKGLTMRFATTFTLPVALALVSCGSGANEETAQETTVAPVEEVDVSELDENVVASGSVAAAIPAAFHGSYDSDGGTCDPADEMQLEVTANEVRFYESAGRVNGAEQGADSLDVLLAMTGEGMSFERAYQMRLSDGGKTISTVSEGESEATERYRCSP